MSVTAPLRLLRIHEPPLVFRAKLLRRRPSFPAFASLEYGLTSLRASGVFFPRSVIAILVAALLLRLLRVREPLLISGTKLL